MIISFYAPMKSPYDTTPSGDRLVARNIIEALSSAGHNVHLATEWCTKNLTGCPALQESITLRSIELAHELIETYKTKPIDLWLTYHTYHKAPDMLGPIVSKALNIPYVLVEASHNPSQEKGPWALGLKASKEAIQAAHLIFTLNPKDRATLEALTPAPIIPLLPFIKLPDLKATHPNKQSIPTLITVGMMRTGNKERSYALLAESLARLDPSSYKFICIGGGPLETQIQTTLKSAQPNTLFLGEQPEESILSHLAKADIFVWPAFHESFGMATLQAQAVGLPAVVGYTPGVAQIVHHELTGLISPAEDTETFAQNIQRLLIDLTLRHRLGENAHTFTRLYHGMTTAAHELTTHLRSMLTQRAA